MRKCEKCGKEWSDKIYPLHVQICVKANDNNEQERVIKDEEDLNLLTRRDLMLLIMSEIEEWEDKENKLKNMKKAELINILEE
jgi:CO dehydrogenase/acetyl-CoA synthase alpha subunit